MEREGSVLDLDFDVVFSLIVFSGLSNPGIDSLFIIGAEAGCSAALHLYLLYGNLVADVMESHSQSAVTIGIFHSWACSSLSLRRLVKDFVTSTEDCGVISSLYVPPSNSVAFFT